jgi:hypothetical protein
MERRMTQPLPVREQGIAIHNANNVAAQLVLAASQGGGLADDERNIVDIWEATRGEIIDRTVPLLLQAVFTDATVQPQAPATTPQQQAAVDAYVATAPEFVDYDTQQAAPLTTYAPTQLAGPRVVFNPSGRGILIDGLPPYQHFAQNPDQWYDDRQQNAQARAGGFRVGHEAKHKTLKTPEGKDIKVWPQDYQQRQNLPQMPR